MKKLAPINAWLVTWESGKDPIPDDCRIAFILHHRQSQNFVRRLLRLAYLSSVSNVAAIALCTNRPRLWPKVASAGGVLWCGSDVRVLYARVVSEFSVNIDPWTLKESVSWREPNSASQRPPRYEVIVTPGEAKSLLRRAAPVRPICSSSE